MGGTRYIVLVRHFGPISLLTSHLQVGVRRIVLFREFDRCTLACSSGFSN